MSLWTDADEAAQRGRAEGRRHENYCEWWGECWCQGGRDPRLPDPPEEYLAALAPSALCCDLHDRTCEPPSELCCDDCTEGAHPAHADGSVCSAPDLSGFRA